MEKKRFNYKVTVTIRLLHYLSRWIHAVWKVLNYLETKYKLINWDTAKNSYCHKKYNTDDKLLETILNKVTIKEKEARK